MAHHLRIANAGTDPRQIGDWAETETARDIRRSLDLVKATDRPSITMIAGAPGTGKTSAVRRFCEAHGAKAIYIQVARGEGTVWNFAHALVSLYPFHMRPKFNCHSEAREKVASFIGAGTVLAVDDAQYLHQLNRKTGQKGEAFEWLRAMGETGGFDLVFCGSLDLPRAVNDMPQLQSRLMRPVVIRQVSRADVAAVVDGTAFAAGQSIDLLHGVAVRGRGLTGVEMVTARAALFAGDKAPGHEHLKAAIIDMKLDGKRAS